MSQPWIAEALAEAERIYQAAVDLMPPKYADHPSREFQQLFANRIGSAELFWMSRNAAALAADLSSTAPPAVTFREMIATSDLPATGLMLWPRSLAELPWTNHRVQNPDALAMTTTWDGLGWIIVDDEITTYLLSRVHEQRQLGLLSDSRPTWSPGQVVRFETSHLDDTPTYTPADHDQHDRVKVSDPLDDHDHAAWPTVSALITCLLILIGQQRVVSTRVVSNARPTNSRQPADHRPTVTMYDLLRPPPGSSYSGPAGASDRAMRRWWVKGHWRAQPHGPRNSLRKWIYIDVHTAGHTDAPEPTAPLPRTVRGVYGSRVQPRHDAI